MWGQGPKFSPRARGISWFGNAHHRRRAKAGGCAYDPSPSATPALGEGQPLAGNPPSGGRGRRLAPTRGYAIGFGDRHRNSMLHPREFRRQSPNYVPGQGAGFPRTAPAIPRHQPLAGKPCYGLLRRLAKGGAGKRGGTGVLQAAGQGCLAGGPGGPPLHEVGRLRLRRGRGGAARPPSAPRQRRGG